MPFRLQDPNENLDYTCDFADVIAAFGSPTPSIDAFDWRLEGGGGSPDPIVSNEAQSGTKIFCHVRELQVGEVYALIGQATISGFVFERTWVIQCEQR